MSILIACISYRPFQQQNGHKQTGAEQHSRCAVETNNGEGMSLIVSILDQLQLLNRGPEQRGCVLEVKTGEGKSTIVALLAALQVLHRGLYVDIVSTLISLLLNGFTLILFIKTRVFTGPG